MQIGVNSKLQSGIRQMLNEYLKFLLWVLMIGHNRSIDVKNYFYNSKRKLNSIANNIW